MASSAYILLLLTCSYCSGQFGGSVDYQDVIYNHNLLVDLYSTNNISTVDLRPLVNLSETMNVSVEMSLFALNDFDEVAGNVELSGALFMSWTDQMMLVYPEYPNFTITNKTDFLVPHGKIWTPILLLHNAVEESSFAGDGPYMCRFDTATLEVLWNPRVFIKGSCSPDVTFYPFDRQHCSFKYVPWGYEPNEVRLSATRDTWGMSSYEENGEWSVVETKAWDWEDNKQSYLELSIVIERKPLYFAFNIIMPVLILCALNNMVFWLPAESGERVGFSVTCFLSFMVLLNMVMDILPRSSSPLSLLCLYLVTMLMFSGAVSAFVIIEMNVFHQPETSLPPSWLQKIVRVVTCRCCKCRRNGISDVHSSNVTATRNDPNSVEVGSITNDQNNKTIEENSLDVDDELHDTEVTWPMVGRVLDRLFFCAFLALEIFFSITFLLPLALRA